VDSAVQRHGRQRCVGVRQRCRRGLRAASAVSLIEGLRCPAFD
jgi:hypothetical protein